MEQEFVEILIRVAYALAMPIKTDEDVVEYPKQAIVGLLEEIDDIVSEHMKGEA